MKENEEKETDARRQEAKKSSPLRELFSWIEIIVAAVLIAFVLNTFIIANSRIPSGSMENTIMTKDRVIGLRLSYTFGDPERDDIAIFKFGWICNRCGRGSGEGEAPETCPVCGQEITRPKTLYYVKRVIGLPGDVIEIKPEGSVRAGDLAELPPGLTPEDADKELVTAALYVNGEKIEEPYLHEPMLYSGEMRTHFEVPENCYLMLGDNRNNSGDARYWENPYISEDKMVAKVLFRYWPSPALLH